MADDKDADRGAGPGERAKDADRGVGGTAPDAVSIATDVFQRVSQLGGLLIVAIVAPIGPCSGSTPATSVTQRALLGIKPASGTVPPEPAGSPDDSTNTGRGAAERRKMIAGGD